MLNQNKNEVSEILRKYADKRWNVNNLKELKELRLLISKLNNNIKSKQNAMQEINELLSKKGSSIQQIGSLPPTSYMSFTLNKVNDKINVYHYYKECWNTRGSVGKELELDAVIKKDRITFLTQDYYVANGLIRALQAEIANPIASEREWKGGKMTDYNRLVNPWYSGRVCDNQKYRVSYINYFENDAKFDSKRPFSGWKDILVYKLNNKIMCMFKKGLVIDFEGNVIKDPNNKSDKKLFERVHKLRKERTNTMSRFRYREKRTIKYLKEKTWDKLSPQDVFYLRNVTERTELLNHFGQQKVLKSVESKVLDSKVINNNPYRLLSLKFPNNGIAQQRANYLEMINPSTGETHLEGVANMADDRMTPIVNVEQALGWRNRDAIGSYNIPVALT